MESKNLIGRETLSDICLGINEMMYYVIPNADNIGTHESLRIQSVVHFGNMIYELLKENRDETIEFELIAKQKNNYRNGK